MIAFSSRQAGTEGRDPWAGSRPGLARMAQGAPIAFQAALTPALGRAVAFLERSQREDGELPVQASIGPDPAQVGEVDPSIFPTALMAWSLSFHPAAAAVRDRALRFLQSEMDRHGLWRHWTKAHPQHGQLPPDLDDTSCVSLALRRAGWPLPGNREILQANRNRDGLFLTWVIPRLRWTRAAHRRATLPQLRHLPTLYLFFRRTSAAPADADAVANANTLFYLGRTGETEAVAGHLLQILRDGRESQCDKWYEDPFAVWYFFSRALGGSETEAADIIRTRIAATPPGSALAMALAMNSLLNLGRVPGAELTWNLLNAQLPSGAWPRAMLYHGGRTKRRDGSFAAPHPDTPYWGSESLTTAFCIEALSRIGQVGE